MKQHISVNSPLKVLNSGPVHRLNYAATPCRSSVGFFCSIHEFAVRPRQVNGCNCAGKFYDTQYIDDSVAAAQAGGSGKYPHRYKDYEKFSFPNCNAPFYEYPIIAGEEIYDGGSPGASRVVYDDNSDFCACITHSGVCLLIDSIVIVMTHVHRILFLMLQWKDELKSILLCVRIPIAPFACSILGPTSMYISRSDALLENDEPLAKNSVKQEMERSSNDIDANDL